MSNVTSLATLRENQTPIAAANVSAGFFDASSFELMQRIAKAFSSSTLVPQQYQGNVANTMIALSMAQRMGADPVMVMQNLYIVHGKPSWSSKFLIATFNACGRFTSMRFRFNGTEGQDDWACQAYATEKATGEEITGSFVSIALAKDEGWYGKNGSKWKTMPQHMLMYRAASFFVNMYAPELSMGLVTTEEANDIIDATQRSDGGYSVTVEDLRRPEPLQVAEKVAEIAEVSEAREVSEFPKINASGALVDARGIGWMERIHSAGKTCNDDGTWRRKRGVDPELIEKLEAAALDRAQRIPEPVPEPPAPRLTLDRIMKGIAGSPDDDTIDEWVDLARDDLTVAFTEADKAMIADAAKTRWQELHAAA